MLYNSYILARNSKIIMFRNKKCIKFEHFGLPRQRHLSPPVLGGLVPLQDETSGSVL